MGIANERVEEVAGILRGHPIFDVVEVCSNFVRASPSGIRNAEGCRLWVGTSVAGLTEDADPKFIVDTMVRNMREFLEREGIPA